MNNKLRNRDQCINKVTKQDFLFFSSDQVSTALSKSWGLLGLLAAVLLEVGLFPTIVDSLAVDVMSVEVLVRFVVTIS